MMVKGAMATLVVGVLEIQLGVAVYNWLLFITLLIHVSTVLISSSVACVVLLYKHIKSPFNDRNKINATITVLTLCALFTATNLLYAIFLGRTLSHPIPASSLEVFAWFITIPMPINSAFNPTIYYVRKKDMRVYVKSVIFRIRGKVWNLISRNNDPC